MLTRTGLRMCLSEGQGTGLGAVLQKQERTWVCRLWKSENCSCPIKWSWACCNSITYQKGGLRINSVCSIRQDSSSPNVCSSDLFFILSIFLLSPACLDLSSFRPVGEPSSGQENQAHIHPGSMPSQIFGKGHSFLATDKPFLPPQKFTGCHKDTGKVIRKLSSCSLLKKRPPIPPHTISERVERKNAIKKSLLASVLLNYVKPISCNIVTEQIISWLRKICGCNYLFILMLVIRSSSCCLHPLYDERSIQRRWGSAEMMVNYHGVRRRRTTLVQMAVRLTASILVFCWY